MKRMHNDSDSHIHENIFFQGNDKHKQLKKGIKNNIIVNLIGKLMSDII